MNRDQCIKGILFDKDGTLLDFEKTWRPVWDQTELLLSNELKINELEIRHIREALGILEEGFTSGSVYVTGTLLEYAQIIAKISAKEEDRVLKVLHKSYLMCIEENKLDIVTLGDIKSVMIYLKQKGYQLGIVTSDSRLSTEYFINKIGLAQLIDFIATDDGVYQMKPHPHMLESFCTQTGLLAEEVAVVGDSLKDIQFGKYNQAGKSIYIESSYSNEEARQLADCVITGIEDLMRYF